MQIEKKDIRALSKDQLRDFFVANNDKAFRGNQVYEWLWSKGAHSFEDMTNVAKTTRSMLEDNFVIKPFDINRLNIFNVWTLEERIYTAFLTLTKDCDVYQAYMTDKIAKAKKNNKNYKKESKEELRKYMLENPDNSSDLNALTSHYVEYLLTIYIKKYENMCK